jgi:glycosyltransferase involved in cell wall biosynthesis
MKAAYPLPNVRFRGFVTDEELDQAYLDDEVFILPTLFEGMPTVVLEAMARAMPVIVTDTGATLELVDDTNGIIIPKQDSAATMQAMRRMIEMPDAEYLAMSRQSLQKFKAKFTWEAVAQAHLKLFRELSQSL